MNRGCWMALVVGALLALPAAFGKEGGDKKKGGDKGGGDKAPLMSLEAIGQKLGDTPLTEEQKTKVAALREQVLKKFDELSAKDEVKAAKEEMKKAKEGGDKDAMKAAAAKLKEVTGGFNPTAEYKTGLEAILTPEQAAKLFAAKGGAKEGGKEGAKKKKEKGGGEEQ